MTADTNEALNAVFRDVEARPKRRQGITGMTIEAQMRGTMCQITEYELDVLRDALISQAAKLAEAGADRLAEALSIEICERVDGCTCESCSALAAHQKRRVGCVAALTPADADAALSRIRADARRQALQEAAAWIESVPQSLPDRQHYARCIRDLARIEAEQ